MWGRVNVAMTGGGDTGPSLIKLRSCFPKRDAVVSETKWTFTGTEEVTLLCNQIFCRGIGWFNSKLKGIQCSETNSSVFYFPVTYKRIQINSVTGIQAQGSVKVAWRRVEVEVEVEGLCHRAESYCNSCVFVSDCRSDVLAVNTESNRAESGWKSNRNV